MFKYKIIDFFSFLMLFCLFLMSSCGPSPEELAATSSAETAAAATSTSTNTPTPTLAPTPTPTVTPTPTPTATPLPGPDPKAMINWEALNLPEDYQAIAPAGLGFGEGDWIMGRIDEDGTQVDYLIEGSFVFGPGWPEVAYGWTLVFPTEFDVEVLDYYIDNYSTQFAGIIENTQGQLLSLIDNSDDPNYKIIGDNSSEAWSVYIAEGRFWVLWGSAFRIGNIGGFVFNRHLFEEEQFIEIGDLARIYADSITNPAYHCRFLSIEPNLEMGVPAFEYQVEGFYPGEHIMVGLSGDVMDDGKSTRTTAVDYVDFADEEGKFHGIMRFGEEAMELANPDFELMISGNASICIANQVVSWPGDSEVSNSPILVVDDDGEGVIPERDPNSEYPSVPCGVGEKLLYLEDFQDDEVQGWPEIESRTQGWNLIPDPDSEGNVFARFSSDKSDTQIFYQDGTFEDAVWRISVMSQGKPEFIAFYWHANPNIWQLYDVVFFAGGGFLP